MDLLVILFIAGIAWMVYDLRKTYKKAKAEREEKIKSQRDHEANITPPSDNARV